MILYINIQSGLPQLNIKKKIGIWIPQKTTRNYEWIEWYWGLTLHNYTVRATSAQYHTAIQKRNFQKKDKKTASEIDSWYWGLTLHNYTVRATSAQYQQKNWNCVSRRASPQAAAVRKKTKKKTFWGDFLWIIQVLNNQVSRRASPQAAAVLY